MILQAKLRYSGHDFFAVAKRPALAAAVSSPLSSALHRSSCISFTRTDRFPSSPRCFLDKRRTKQSQGFPSSPVCPAVSMREFQDLMDFFPYCLLVALPVFIALSPMPVHAVAVAAAASSSASAQDFPVHRYVT